MRIKIKQLESLTKKALKKHGYNNKEVKIIKDLLIYAQLRGNNQGIVKLTGKFSKDHDAGTPKIVKKTKISALIDGSETHAMIVMNQITDLAIKIAKKSGIGITGNFNTSESTGAIGYYVDKMAKAGLIGIAFSSAPFKTTAPHGSNQALFCTNPMAYGFPTDSDPIILDMTTSSMAYYGLIEAKIAGKSVPEGVGYDSSGNPTTNSAEIMSGALKTIAGHKGSGLALVVQILAGTLVGADYFDNNSDNAGNLVIAINPDIFMPSEKFKTKVSDVVSKIKSARRLEGTKEILVPGERGNKLAKKRLEEGIIEIEDNLLKSLKEFVKGTR